MKSLLTGIIFILSGFSYADETSERIEKIHQLIQSQINQSKAASLSVGFSVNGERTTFAYGFKDLENKIPLKTEDYFAIGSVTKTFTSLLLAKAVSEGKVGLEETLDTYLEELKGTKAGFITLKELSTHSSGLQRDMIPREDPLQPLSNFTHEEALTQAKVATFEEITDDIRYSNFGTALLGMALEKAYGESFEPLFRKEILTPLAINQMNIVTDDAILKKMAKKYDQGFLNIPVWTNLGVYNPVGSFKATSDIMLSYLEAQLFPESTPLAKAITESQRVLVDLPKSKLAYGWFLLDFDGTQVYWHNGSTAGFGTNAFFEPKSKKALVTLATGNSGIQCIATLFFTDRECQPDSIQIEDGSQLESKPGVYLIQDFNLTFQVRDSGHGFLSTQVMGQATSVRLFKEADDKYSFLNGEGKVEFVRDDAGQIVGFNFSQGGSPFYFAQKL